MRIRFREEKEERFRDVLLIESELVLTRNCTRVKIFPLTFLMLRSSPCSLFVSLYSENLRRAYLYDPSGELGQQKDHLSLFRRY